MRADSHTELPHNCLRPIMFFFFFFLILWRCRFFRVFFVPFPLSLRMENRATRGYLTTAFALLWLSFFLLFFGGVAFSEYFLYHYRFLLVWKVRRTFFPAGWCFSTL